jgi:hypothetical protein
MGIRDMDNERDECPGCKGGSLNVGECCRWLHGEDVAAGDCEIRDADLGNIYVHNTGR